MTTPEGKVKAWAIRQYDLVFPGHWRIAPRGGPFGKSGAGDHIICWRGIFIMIEIKSDEGSVTDLQLIQLRRVQQAFGIAAVLRGKDLAKLHRIREAAMGIYTMLMRLTCALRESKYDQKLVDEAIEFLRTRCKDDIPNQ